MAGNDDTYCTGLECKQRHRGMEVVHCVPEEMMGDESHVPEGMRLVPVEIIIEVHNRCVDDDFRAELGKYL